MPQLGETVAEGKITKWFKAAGEQVKPGDSLFEIETDKASMEVPSTTTGVLVEIRAPAGAVVPVGAIVGVIGDGTSRMAVNPAAPAAAPKAAAAEAPAPSAVAASVTSAPKDKQAEAPPAASSPAAPSLVPGAFPAVTVPSLLKAGFNFASASSEVSSRGDSSYFITRGSPLFCGTSIGKICASKKQDLRARTAFWWLCSAN